MENADQGIDARYSSDDKPVKSFEKFPDQGIISDK